MCKVIAISQQKGGAGKSTIAAHLAIALGQKRKRITLIDIDPQGSLTKWHEIRAEKYGADFTGVNFINVSGWKISNVVDSHRRDSDIIIIDSPPHTETESKGAIRSADIVIIPMQPSPTDLWATESTFDFAISEKKPTYILLNRFNPKMKISNQIKPAKFKFLKNSLGNRVAFANSIFNGKCVTETEPNSASSEEIKMVVNEICTLLNKVTK